MERFSYSQICFIDMSCALGGGIQEVTKVMIKGPCRIDYEDNSLFLR
jgi:hypothetical protein